MRANAIRGCDLRNSKRNRMAGAKLLGWSVLEAVSRYTIRRLDSRPLAYSQPDDPYTGRNDFGSAQLSDIRQTEFLMHTADRFLKFATECQIMAQLAPQGENQQTWNRLAERWLHCAELTEQLDTELRSSELRRRQKHLKIVAH
jgi:hypothetical protein